jgi:hypothetical protein
MEDKKLPIPLLTGVVVIADVDVTVKGDFELI